MNEQVHMLQAVEHFLKAKPAKRFGKYYCDGQRLVYQAMVTKELVHPNDSHRDAIQKLANENKIVLVENNNYRCKIQLLQENVIATTLVQPNGAHLHVGNSSILPLIGRRVSFGRERTNRYETEVQKRIAESLPMIPFVVFTQSGLNLKNMVMIERGEPEQAKRKVRRYDSKLKEYVDAVEQVHFTGASLFKVQDKYFLFDIDRREQKHNVFNPFLAEIPKPVETIEAAYRALKPQEVIDAEARGLKVKRQGEWFFIPVNYDGEPDRTPEADRQWLPEFRPMTLQAGPNRPNHAQYGVQAQGLCKGKISHAGREHADLILKDWYKAVPNTATRSFTITGDVD